MSPYRRPLQIVCDAEGTFVAPRPSSREFALLEEMSYIWREAQAEANVAYAEWCQRLCARSYAVYRAAQDRADAAQDDLADLHKLLAA